ncbi:outer membrane lipoprotein carrier protein LolA [Zavarzinia compransoris]|uniref:LolA family protein n=1 Tax=Zavarzinia marina TaxID=2911065 RepID=UPI001F351C2A|nr:outer-membrane lipoprotein carrier protein LolA [Zavarzinia marina]MCF4165605.1 outer membrane lipoprotein carrier protein LolA [Zavarzinia marina]
MTTTNDPRDNAFAIPTRRNLLGLALGFGALAAALRPGAALAALGDRDKADIARVETLFNGIETMEARFTQVDSNGGYAQGRLLLRRPGRLRFEYDAPTPLLIVADGTWLVVYDKEIKQVDRYPLGRTPIGVLVRDHVSFADGLEVTEIQRDAQAFAVSVIDPDHKDDGKLTLVFTENPFEFRQWQVLDAQGITTVVSLEDIRRGGSFDPKLFTFIDPPGATASRHDR